jgi:hypothetical protein
MGALPERAVLLYDTQLGKWWERRIRGEWAYRSVKGNNKVTRLVEALTRNPATAEKNWDKCQKYAKWGEHELANRDIVEGATAGERLALFKTGRCRVGGIDLGVCTSMVEMTATTGAVMGLGASKKWQRGGGGDDKGREQHCAVQKRKEGLQMSGCGAAPGEVEAVEEEQKQGKARIPCLLGDARGSLRP